VIRLITLIHQFIPFGFFHQTYFHRNIECWVSHICICNVYLFIMVYDPLGLPLVVGACLTFAFFLLVVYSLFPLFIEIKSFDFILITRLKLQKLSLWTLILKLRILQACSMQSSDCGTEDGVQQLIDEAHGTRVWFVEEQCFQL